MLTLSSCERKESREMREAFSEGLLRVVEQKWSCWAQGSRVHREVVAHGFVRSQDPLDIWTDAADPSESQSDHPLRFADPRHLGLQDKDSC